MERGVLDYKRLLDIQRRLGVERDIDKLLPLVMSEISLLLDADRSTIFLIDWKSMELRARFAEGVDDELSIKLRIGIVGSAILQKTPVNIVRASEHPYFNPEIDQMSGYTTHNILVVPLINKNGNVTGGIELLNKISGRFLAADEDIVRQTAVELGRRERLSDLSVSEAGEIICRLVSETACDRGSLFAVDERRAELFSVYAHGLEGQTIRLGLKLGIAGLVAVTGEGVNLTDARHDARFNEAFDMQTGYKTKSILCVPLRNQKNEVLGVIEVINKRSEQGAFDETDRELIEGVSSIIAIAVENALLIEDHEAQFLSLISALAASIDARDSLTAGHSERVARHAVGIARQMGFNDEALDVLHIAALLHDYGKIGIDDAVLRKPGRLSAEEYDHMKTHVTITRKILERIHFSRKYRDVPSIAASHHEYLDGTGYASGLLAKDIPFLSRIITVADIFEALTADRHYRRAMTQEEAIRELEKGAASKFDIHALAALKKHLDAEAELWW